MASTRGPRCTRAPSRPPRRLPPPLLASTARLDDSAQPRTADRAVLPTWHGHLDSPHSRVDRKNLVTTTEAMTMTWYYGTPMGWGGFTMMTLTMLLFWG